MKKLFYLLFAGLTIASACQNTQQKDEKAAREKANEAVNAADASAAQQAASDSNAVNAVVAAIQSNIDHAMSKIAMPDFQKANARSLAEDFHKYLSKLVNTNSGKKANEYMDKLNDLKKEYDKKVTDEKLDPADKKKLEKYISDMLSAVENANP